MEGECRGECVALPKPRARLASARAQRASLAEPPCRNLMPDARVVLIRVGTRTKAVSLPPGFDLEQIELKVSDAAEGLHDFKLVHPVSARTLAALQVGLDRRASTSRENARRAQERAAEDRGLDQQDIDWMAGRLGPEQASLWTRLTVTLGFVRSLSQGGGLRLTAADWVRRVREVCPEPWALDWTFVRLWLISPMSMANQNAFDGQKQPVGKLHGIRRSVAIKKFMEAWGEQKGAVTAPPVEEARLARGSNHPFAILREAIRTSRVSSKEMFFRALTEYRDARVLSPGEYEEGKRAFVSGTWFGFPVPFPVV